MYIYVYLKDRTTWLPKQNVDLLKICLETNFNTYDGKTYTQTDGTLIGKSISGLLAGIFVAWLEETVVKNGRFKAQIIFWRRMKGYIMETHTNKYINWRSNVPRSAITEAMEALIFL